MGVGDQHHTSAVSPPGNSSGTHCTGVWVGPRFGLDKYGDEKNSCPSLGGNPEPPSPEPVATLHTLSPAPIDLAPFRGNLSQLFYSQHPLLVFLSLFNSIYISSSSFLAFGLYILSILSPIFLHNSVFSLESPPSFVLFSKPNASTLSVPHALGHNIPTLFRKSHLLFNVPFATHKLL